MYLPRRSVGTEPGADRGSRAGIPRGVVDATGIMAQLSQTGSSFEQPHKQILESLSRSLPLAVLYRIRSTESRGSKRLDSLRNVKIEPAEKFAV